MDPQIEALQHLEKLNQMVQEFTSHEEHKKHKGVDEYRKIQKQKKNQKTNQFNTDDKGELLNKIKKFVNDVKNQHKELSGTTKKIEIATQNKESINKDNEKIRNQIKILESLRTDLIQRNNSKQAEYNKILDQEKKNRELLIEQFQKEIQDIQNRLQKAATDKAIKEQEIEQLKSKLSEIQEHVDKRDKLFDEELGKIENARKEKEQKIEEQISSMAKTTQQEESVEEQQEKMKNEVELLDKHLNPYLKVQEDVQKIIDKTNQQFNIYKDEAEKLQLQIRSFEEQSLNNQRKCERSGIFILEKVKEHNSLQQELQKKKEQLTTLNNLLSQIQQNQLQ